MIPAVSRAAWHRICAGAALLMTLMLSGCGAFNPNENSTVGIIGGSDGPTAVFVTSQFSPMTITLLVILGIAVVVSVVILVRRARKKKK